MSANAREHYWDAVRAGLMFLGIPYHAARVYGVRFTWAVHSNTVSTAFDWVGFAIHSFRMQVFFIISGYFAGSLLIRRDPFVWLKGRLMRVGVPLISAMILINPIQMYTTELARFGDGPVNWTQATYGLIANIQKPGSHWILHLWFLVVLLSFCTILASAHIAFPSIKYFKINKRIDSHIVDHFSAYFLTILISIGLYSVFVENLMNGFGLHDSGLLAVHVHRGLIYAPYFALGVTFSRAPALLNRFSRLDPVLAICAILSITIFVISNLSDSIPHYITSFATPFSGLLTANVLIATSMRWLNRPNSGVKTLVDVSFFIYLIHMPILQVFALAFLRVDYPIAIEYLSICALTVVSALVLGIWIRRVPILNFLFNGVPLARFEPSAAPAARTS
jgi:glucan biosynthesis protein C